MFDLKQSCIWDCIINGKHQPLGKIIDTWRRIEFQLRGTPHCHGMACVIHDGILAEFFDEADEEQISKIAKIVVINPWNFKIRNNKKFLQVQNLITIGLHHLITDI